MTQNATRVSWVSVTRSGVVMPALQHIPVYVEHVSPQVMAGAGGAVPHNTYTLYSTQGVPDIRQGDLLTDNNGTQYRVSGVPWQYELDHIEIQMDKIVGATP